MKDPLFTMIVSIDWQLKKIRAFMKTFKMTLPRPRFEICRGIEGHAILLKQDHDPVPARFIPEDLGIPGVVRAYLAIAVQNRVANIASERSSIVCAVRDALHLFMRDAVKRRIDQHERVLTPASIVVVIYEARAGPW